MRKENNMKQLRKFDIRKMGHKKGMCLQNVRLGFGIGAKFKDAKEDMLNNKKKGTLHSMKDLPKNAQVPVYVDSSSIHEHIIAYDKGVYYTDGKRLTSVKGIKFFGWGELLEDVRVIELSNENKYNVNDMVEVNFDVTFITDDKGNRVYRIVNNDKDNYLEVMVENGGYQFWLPSSLIKGNNFRARVKIIGIVGDKVYKMKVFSTEFDCKESYIVKKL